LAFLDFGRSSLGGYFVHRLFALLALAGICAIAAAQSYTIQTFAGGGTPANGLAASASLGTIGGVAVDGSGTVYISLTQYQVVVRVDSSGNLIPVAGNGTLGSSGDGGPATSAQLNDPAGIAFDSSGSLFIADTNNDSVRKVSNGIITTLTAGFMAPPTGVVTDRAGNVYVQEGITSAAVISASTHVVTQIIDDEVVRESPSVGGYQSVGIVLGMAVDPSGNVYTVGDGGNVWEINIQTLKVSLLTNGPGGQKIAIDSSGNIYIATWSDVYEINGGSTTLIAGDGSAIGGTGPALSAQIVPTSLAVDASGSVYIADEYGPAVRKVTLGTISTVAGGNLNAPGDNGPASAAQLDNPTGVAVDSSGNVYIADANNWRVRKVSSGIISTIAGGGTDEYDNGPANGASITPSGVALDQNGNLFFNESDYGMIGEVTKGNLIVLAGSGGKATTANGAATGQTLTLTAGIAVDATGAVYFGSFGNYDSGQISKLSDGAITTVAGAVHQSSGNGFTGDGGAASAAWIEGALGLALDSFGNLFIADTINDAIREVSNGTITDVAGQDGVIGGRGLSGDGGPASAALLNSPQGVAVDSSGNVYIADTGNNRIRRVSNGIITTIAGGGASLGDGGPATSAQLASPIGITVDGSGKIYIADSGNNRIRVLIPASTGGGGGSSTCTVAAVPLLFQVDALGSQQTLTIVTSDPSCSWSIAGLPFWMSASPASGTGSGTSTLTIAANSGAARTAALGVGGSSINVDQGPGAAWCAYAIAPASQGIAAAGGSGTIAVTASSGCVWSVAIPPSWVTLTSAVSGSGNGSVSFTVSANTAAPRSASFQVAGLTATIQQNGAAESSSGVMGHFAAGAGWETTFTLVNAGYTPADAQLDFFDDNGAALTGLRARAPRALSGSAPADTLLAPAAMFQQDAPAGTTTSQTGWANLMTDGFVSGFGVFRLPVGTGVQEAVVPAETRSSSSFILPFDNTGGYYYGVAVSNLSTTDTTMEVVFRDAITGTQTSTGLFPLAAGGHTQFLLADQFPQTAGVRGTAEFLSTGFTAGNISVLGLRFNPNHAFTSVPVFVQGAQTAGAPLANAGAMSQIAAGGGWSTLITLVNTGSASANAQLSFFDDNGNAMALPFSFPLSTGIASQSGASLGQAIAPGGMLLVQCAAPGSQTTQAGWAQLQTDGSVSGFAVFQSTVGAVSQEAAAPLFPLTTAGSLLAFDNTNGYNNGVALANNSAAAVSVPVTVHDPTTGAAIATDTINLPAWGHTSFLLNDRFPSTAGAKGTIEFGVSGGQVSVLGLRANANNAFTSIPPIVRQ
jgi:sugar lactone lactonase YvrE